MSTEIVRGVAAVEHLQLAAGNHPTREEGICAMEAVAWLSGLPHSDRPTCTSEIIAGYVRHLNDHMPDEERARLVAFLPSLIGTADPKMDHVLNNYFAWQALHSFAPAALRADEDGEFGQHADRLEEQHRLYKAEATAKAIMDSWYLGRDPRPSENLIVLLRR